MMSAWRAFAGSRSVPGEPQCVDAQCAHHSGAKEGAPKLLPLQCAVCRCAHASFSPQILLLHSLSIYITVAARTLTGPMLVQNIHTAGRGRKNVVAVDILLANTFSGICKASD